ncbi:MAG: CARDB domain-containing protein [Pseudomonadota bacterium]
MRNVIRTLAAIMMFFAPTLLQAQTRDTETPRDTKPIRATTSTSSNSASGDRADSVPQADLYAGAGGFDEDGGTNWVLVIVNKGAAASAATNVAFVLETTSGVETVGKFQIAGIGSDQSRVLVVNSLIPVSAIKRLYAHIDRPDIVDESNEANNRFIYKDDRADSERPAYIKIPMKRLSANDSGDARLRKRPGRAKFADGEGADASGATARASRQQEPIRDQAASNFAGVDTEPLIKCGQDQNGLWGCNCSTTNAVICSQSMKYAGCKTIKEGGLANPDKWAYSCGKDHSDG